VDALRQIEEWGCGHAAAACGDARHGDVGHRFAWASVTKPAAAVAMLVAAEEGLVDLDEPAGPPGSTFRHLLAHTSGLPFDAGAPVARPGTRRIYSNAGFDAAAALVAERAEMPFADYFHTVWQGTGITLDGPASAGAHGTIEDLVGLARELSVPSRLAPETLAEATSVQFAGLDGVLPGFGRQTPNDWGLGFEIRNGKSPHWTGSRNSPRTFGHFGRSGTFVWVDPEVDIWLCVLTDRAFGDWAAAAWPVLSDAVLTQASSSSS
jgi:CubicO group peptidase (beta-lactamase class C family)